MEIPFKAFHGVDNVGESFAGDLVHLARADNCDLDNDGKVRRRKGTTKLNATATHSLYSNGEFALFRQGTSLYRLANDFATGIAIKTGLVSGARMSYVRVPPGRVFLSDGLLMGWTDGSDFHAWGIAVPTAQPAAAAVSGALPQGRYQYALTFLRNDGEESGTSRAGMIECSGGITFSSIEVSADPEVTAKAIYLTRPGGKLFKRAMKIPNAATTATYKGDALDLGVDLQTQFLGPPPLAGTVLARHNARTLIGAGPFLQHSAPWRPELFAADAFTAFTAAVRFAAPVATGVWVGTGAEIVFLRGDDIDSATYELKARAGALRNSVAYVDGSKVANKLSGVVPVFATERGICVGTEQGELVNLTEDVYEVSSAILAAAVTRTAGVAGSSGLINQYLAVLR